MTTGSTADYDIAEILQYMDQQLRNDDNLRRELTTAVRRKDERAMRKVAKVIWEGLKWLAPITLSAFLAMLGFPVSF